MVVIAPVGVAALVSGIDAVAVINWFEPGSNPHDSVPVHGRGHAHERDHAHECGDGIADRLSGYEDLGARVWALRENVRPYDAWYIALAELIDAPLATLASASDDGPYVRVPHAS